MGIIEIIDIRNKVVAFFVGNQKKKNSASAITIQILDECFLKNAYVFG